MLVLYSLAEIQRLLWHIEQRLLLGHPVVATTLALTPKQSHQNIMAKLYRFRKMQHLLDTEFNELENQTLYFASADELNDPMEQTLPFLWRGDAIIWLNLFKHYINCLSVAWWLVHTAGDFIHFLPESIPWMIYHVEIPNKELWLSKIFARVLAKEKLSIFAKQLEERQHPATQDELTSILHQIHFRTGNILFEEFQTDKSLSQDTAGSNFPNPDIGHLHELFDYRNSHVQLRPEDQGIVIDHINRRLLQHTESILLNTKFKDSQEHNAQFLTFDFTKSYVFNLGQLAFPAWHIACFTREYSNPTLWSHYADAHKGACLIFGVQPNGKQNAIKLRTSSNHEEVRFHHLHEVTYRPQREKINFFENLGHIALADLKDRWYRDNSGNLSRCYGNLGSKEWMHKYWNTFHASLCTKSNDWQYEKESRVIINKFCHGSDQIRHYEFSALQGIIFGIATATSDKLKVKEILEYKCRKFGHDVPLYQAYSHESGELGIYLIDGFNH